MSDAPSISAAPAADEPQLADTQRAELEDLITQAKAKYAFKDYSAAAELFSQATELQASIHGDMAIENADILYDYGKCLYQVAVSKSDVLGSKVAGEGKAEPEKPKAKTTSNGSSSGQRVAEEAVSKITDATSAAEPKPTENKPYFQFTGDENWDDSDDEEDDGEGADGEAGDDEEEDDFANAFEVLDLARLLSNRKLEIAQAEVDTETSTSKGKGKAADNSDSNSIYETNPTLRALKERLADIHDLQAEISLEGERFPAAAADFEATLALKSQLFPPDHNQIAECHFKLSLALEFSSVTQQRDAEGNVDESQPAHVDEEMRKEAARHMEIAIESCKARLAREQAALAEEKDETKITAVKKEIANVKEIIADMEQRLLDLSNAPISVNDPTSTGTLDGTNPLSGILGQILGESATEQKKRIEEATANANDLSGLVRRKKEKGSAGGTPAPVEEMEKEKVGGKRKVGFVDEVDVLGEGSGGESDGKRVKFA